MCDLRYVVNCAVAVKPLTPVFSEGLLTSSTGSSDAMRNASAAAAAGSGTSTPLDALVQQAEGRQLRALVRADPQLLRPLIHQLGHASPELLSEIASNPASFLSYLTAPVPPADMRSVLRYAVTPRSGCAPSPPYYSRSPPPPRPVYRITRSTANVVRACVCC